MQLSMNSLTQLAGKITFSTHAPNTHTLAHTHHEVFVVSNLQQFSPHLPTTTTTTARETTVKKGEKKILSTKKNETQARKSSSISSPFLSRSPSPQGNVANFCNFARSTARAAYIKINIKNKLELPAAFINF